MDSSWLSGIVAMAGLIVTLTTMLIGFCFRLSRDLSSHKTHVAESYVTKDEFKAHAERLERQMENGFDRIYDALNRRRRADGDND